MSLILSLPLPILEHRRGESVGEKGFLKREEKAEAAAQLNNEK